MPDDKQTPASDRRRHGDGPLRSDDADRPDNVIAFPRPPRTPPDEPPPPPPAAA